MIKRFAMVMTIHRQSGVLKADFSSIPRRARGFALVLALFGVPFAISGIPAGKASAQAISLSEEIVSDPKTGAAILGFDAVAYFIAGEAIPGSAEFQLMHQGKVWYFVSAANMAAFRAKPELYTPAFGGYDPVAIAAGFAVSGAPEFFLLSGERLYLFRRPENRDIFRSNPDIPSLAQQNWPQVKRDMVP